MVDFILNYYGSHLIDPEFCIGEKKYLFWNKFGLVIFNPEYNNEVKI